MTDPAIRVALDAAEEAARRSLYPGMCRADACMLSACVAQASAAAIAAFLRSLPKSLPALGLAAAVEKAARDE